MTPHICPWFHRDQGHWCLYALALLPEQMCFDPLISISDMNALEDFVLNLFNGRLAFVFL